jgi:hypothetical protein
VANHGGVFGKPIRLAVPAHRRLTIFSVAAVDFGHTEIKLIAKYFDFMAHCSDTLLHNQADLWPSGFNLENRREECANQHCEPISGVTFPNLSDAKISRNSFGNPRAFDHQ